MGLPLHEGCACGACDGGESACTPANVRFLFQGLSDGSRFSLFSFSERAIWLKNKQTANGFLPSAPVGGAHAA